VYVQEIPSGVHTITGVATSITAFVGAAPSGPINSPISCFSFGDFQRMFGGLTAGFPLTFAVNDFFLNGGSQAVIVRVVVDQAAVTAAATPATPASSGSSPASSSASPSSTPAPSSSATPAATLSAASAAQLPLGGALTLTASSPGAWGNNLAATVNLATKDPSNTNLFNLTVMQLVPGSAPQQIVAQETFLNLSISPADLTYVGTYLAQNSSLVTFTGTAPKSAPAASAVNAKTGLLTPYLATAGSGQDGSAPGEAQIFDTSLQAAKQGIYALDMTDIFNILVIPPYKSPMTLTDVESLVSSAAAYCQTRRAFLLVDPPDTWDNPNPLETFSTISSDLGQLRSASLAPSNAAVFYPRLLKPNPAQGNQIQTFPASGSMAGIFARTDAQRGVWKAPAGIDATIAGITGLTVALNNSENGLFNPIGVNCLRTFPIIGSVVWGSRTLNGADVLANDYKYIPVRRFALFLEESLYRGTQWVVFEPNDEPLWAQIRLNVGAFMQTLFRQGAFQGASSSQAYFVKCDDETTTQTDIDNGIVNIIVGFAPLKPAEFVVLQIEQMAGTIQT
jgi:phage tail sheath protein FI